VLQPVHNQPEAIATGHAELVPLSGWFKRGSSRKTTGAAFFASVVAEESPVSSGTLRFIAEPVIKVML
jgi:hypothetical protein